MLFWGILQILRQVKQQPQIWEGKGNEGMKDLCGVMLKNTEILNYHTALSRNWIEITFPSLLLSTFSHICNVSPLVLAELYEGCIFFFVCLHFTKKLLKFQPALKGAQLKGFKSHGNAFCWFFFPCEQSIPLISQNLAWLDNNSLLGVFSSCLLSKGACLNTSGLLGFANFNFNFPFCWCFVSPLNWVLLTRYYHHKITTPHHCPA